MTLINIAGQLSRKRKTSKFERKNGLSWLRRKNTLLSLFAKAITRIEANEAPKFSNFNSIKFSPNFNKFIGPECELEAVHEKGYKRGNSKANK